MITRNPTTINDTLELSGPCARTLLPISHGTMVPILYWSTSGLSIRTLRRIGVLAASRAMGIRVDGCALVVLYESVNGYGYERHMPASC